MSIVPGYGAVMGGAKKLMGHVLRTGPVPEHIGFVMDGNRRFARAHQMELKEGHSAGFDSMLRLLELCYECGVRVATVFAFSIENFKRSSLEVSWLMELLKMRFQQIVENGDLCDKYGIKIKIIGDMSLLPQDVQDVLRRVEKITSTNERAVLNVCIPYTSRDDMCHSIKSIVSKVSNHKLTIDSIDEDTISDNLYTLGSPPLQLLIRTSGTYRLSDFLLWECHQSSTDIEIIDTLWPEFTPFKLFLILLRYSYRHR